MDKIEPRNFSKEKKMKCVLHIGTEKTGTTSIQTWLYSNYAELSTQRIALSKSLENNNNRDLCAFFQSSSDDFFIDDFFIVRDIKNTEEKEQFFLGFLNNFSQEINRLSVDHDYMVISSEHFHSRLTDVNDIKSLHEFLSKHFDSVKVVCYFREQADLRKSLYSNALQGGYESPLVEFDQNIGEESHYYNYLMMLSKWEKVFGIDNIEAVLYTREHWFDRDIRKDFIKRVFDDIDLNKLNYSVEKVNVGVSELQSIFIRAINKCFNANNQMLQKSAPQVSIRDNLVYNVLNNKSLMIGELFDARSVNFYQAFDGSNRLFFEKFFGKPENIFQAPSSSEEKKKLFSSNTENAIFEGIYSILNYINMMGVLLGTTKDNKYIFLGDDIRLMSLVGKRTEDRIVSTGQTGWLMYGPYIPMEAGSYQVIIHCTVGEGGLGGAYLDIIARMGKLKIATYTFEKPDAVGCFIVPAFTLYAPCANLEVRVHVTDKTDLQISRLEIVAFEAGQEDVFPDPISLVAQLTSPQQDVGLGMEQSSDAKVADEVTTLAGAISVAAVKNPTQLTRKKIRQTKAKRKKK